MNKSKNTAVTMQIKEYDYQLSILRKNLNKSETVEKLYNKMLVERAVLLKSTQKEENIISKLLRRVFIKEKRISDYF